MKEYQLYATMGAGFESVVNKELQGMGYKTRVENGRVFFKGTQEDIVKTNLWLRTADRVKILLKEFRATDFDTLFNETYDYDWAEWVITISSRNTTKAISHTYRYKNIDIEASGIGAYEYLRQRIVLEIAKNF